MKWTESLVASGFVQRQNSLDICRFVYEKKCISGSTFIPKLNSSFFYLLAIEEKLFMGKD